MTKHHETFVPRSCSLTDLRYGIRSARAVVEALIACDRTTAEEAALRTCRDCELLIQLIYDLIRLLRDAQSQHFGLDPVATTTLVCRADRVLSLIDAPPSMNRPSVISDPPADVDTTRVQPRGGCFKRQGDDAAPTSSSETIQEPTVASLGVRVRLVPVEADHLTSPMIEDCKQNAAQATSGEAPLRTDDR